MAVGRLRKPVRSLGGGEAPFSQDGSGRCGEGGWILVPLRI